MREYFQYIATNVIQKAKNNTELKNSIIFVFDLIY